MDKKTLLAVGLSIAILIGWNVWYFSYYKDQINASRAKSTVSKEADAPPATNGGPVSPPAAATQGSPAMADGKPAPTANPVNLSSEQPSAEKVTVVDTGVTRITLTSRGGVVRSLELTKFPDELGAPYNMVNPKAPFLPLSLQFATAEASGKINKTFFVTDAPESVTLSADAPSATINYYLRLENGVGITKKLVFHHLSYRTDVEIGMDVPGSDVTGSTFAVAWAGLGGVADSYTYEGPVVLLDGKRLEGTPSEKENQVHAGKLSWGGMANKYFCAVFIPEAEKGKMTAAHVGEKLYSTALELVSGAAPGRFGLYVGPKDHAILENEGKELVRIINYGWFDILANPLYLSLIWIYKYVGNFGWAIILLTVLVKLAFWPMTQSSFQSVEKMREVQPQLKKIQDRWKNDKAKMNEEMIALYREHKINPLSGCLPILLQIPVFVALYKVLLESIELAGAPFIFWIHDLSIKDPYYITPVLMGISMFVQQKMTPATGDPVQRNIMLFLPIIFTFMFINFPSGLVVYWLVNNLLSILQQYMIRLKQQEK